MSTTLQQAITAIKSGDKKKGKRLLTKVLRTDSRNETAWLWMAYVVDSKAQRRECLARVITINPNNEKAWRGLTTLDRPGSSPPSPPASPPPALTGATSPVAEPIPSSPQPTESNDTSPTAGGKASRYGYFWCLWMMVFLLATISIVGGANLVERWNTWSQFAQSGVTTLATIVGSRVDERDTYYVTYSFDVPMFGGNFKQFKKEDQISQELYDHLKPGSLIRVQYLFENPSVVKIQSRGSLGNLIFWTVMGLLASVATGLLAVVGPVSWVVRQSKALFKKEPPKPKIVWEGAGPPPLKQWTGTYTFGRDNYEEYFIIETDDGTFVGEGGMEILKVLPNTSPKQVIAFDVGIFDKTDITTISRVIMSEYAYNDETIQTMVETNPHAEAVLAQPGAEFTLESKAMRIEAKIENMVYGEESEESNVYFDSLTVSLAIFLKEGVDLEQPMDIPTTTTSPSRDFQQ